MKITPPVPPGNSGFLIELGEILSGQMTLPVDHECSGGTVVLQDDDKFLGTVPAGPTRLVWLAHRYYSRLADEQKVAFEHATTGTTVESQARLLANRYQNRANAYKNVFWAAVYDFYYPDDDFDGLTLRQGWAVVATESSAERTAMELIRKLAGMRGVKIDRVNLDPANDDD